MKPIKTVKNVKLSSRQKAWREFMAWTDAHSDSRWVFRGLADTAFELVPGAGRDKESYDPSVEVAVLEVFKRRATEFLGAHQILNDWDALALAQHHGAPTRLMDWTSNALVACYFAVTSHPAEGADARIVAHRVTADSIIDVDLHPQPFNCKSDGIILPRSLTNRISHQSGLFSVHANPTTPFKVAGSRTGASAEPFVIERDVKSYFVRRLFYFGFDPQRIMGGLDGIGARLKWQYDRNIGLGTVR